MTSQIRLYLELGAAVVLLAAFGAYTIHERSVQHTIDMAVDARALAAARKQADAETALNLERAAKADAGAISAQKAVDDYRTANPIGPVRLCTNTNHSQRGVRQAGPQNSGTPGPGSGADPVRTVPDGTAGPDIGPGLDALVQAAGRLATLYSDQQQR